MRNYFLRKRLCSLNCYRWPSLPGVWSHDMLVFIVTSVCYVITWHLGFSTKVRMKVCYLKEPLQPLQKVHLCSTHCFPNRNPLRLGDHRNNPPPPSIITQYHNIQYIVPHTMTYQKSCNDSSLLYFIRWLSSCYFNVSLFVICMVF